jgi:gamma-glutamylcyclotransferase (GGCT)/AIG2-like uncharacterized protein YtfP
MNKLVAVYGSLRKGLGNHRVLGASKLVGTSLTGPDWEMFSLGGFPGVRKGNTRITVEVYHVTEESVATRLDGLEGYRGPSSPNNFYGKEVVKTEAGDAEMYTLLEGYEGSPIVEGGNWVAYNNLLTSSRNGVSCE